MKQIQFYTHAQRHGIPMLHSHKWGGGGKYLVNFGRQ